MSATEKNGSGGPLEPHRSHRVSEPYNYGQFPPQPSGEDARLSRIDRQHGTARFYNEIERAVRAADLAARAHLGALRDGDGELAAATLKCFVELSDRIRNGGRN